MPARKMAGVEVAAEAVAALVAEAQEGVGVVDAHALCISKAIRTP